MHIQGLGRLDQGSGVSGLPLDTTRVCLGPLGCHGYDRKPKPVQMKKSTMVKLVLCMCTLKILTRHSDQLVSICTHNSISLSKL